MVALILGLVLLLAIVAPGVWSRKPERREAVRALLGSLADLIRGSGSRRP